MDQQVGRPNGLPGGARLEPLHADHGPALLRFEQENRDYFAATVPDRGDDFFRHFDDVLHARLAEQGAGICRFHVLVEPGDQIVGRVNLVDITDGTAELGYRIAERAAGRGLATAAVRLICLLATTDYGLTSLQAATTVDNPASQAVLRHAGFEPNGDIVLSGRPGIRFRLTLDEADRPVAGT